MDHSEQIAVTLQASFQAFGTDATWPGIAQPVRVIFPPETNGEDILQAGRGRVITPKGVLHVRVSDVASPQKDEEIALFGGETFKILARPEMIKGGHVWQCQVMKVEV